MQLQKDVLIAGGVVVVCVALVVVALVATGKKDSPTDRVASGGPSESYTPSPYNEPATLGSPPSMPGDGFPPAPSPSNPGLGQPDGPSVFAPSPIAQQPPMPPLSPFNPTGEPSHAPGMLPPPGTMAPPAAAAGTHTVGKGETLGDISATHYGTTKHWRKIVEANPGLDPARLKIGQVLQIPAVESAPAAAAVDANAADSYTVKKGESYYTIAKKVLGSSSRWREIERLNNIPAEDLRVGAVIKLPPKEGAGATAGGTPAPGAPAAVGGGKTHVVAKGETLGDISKAYFGTTTKWKQIVEANPGVRPENLKVGQTLNIPDLPAGAAAPAPGAAGPAAGGNTYTVKSGDTLESIAASTLGKKTAWKQIVEANPGLEPTSLRIGQVLTIPGGSAAPAAPAPAPLPGPGGFAPLPGPAAPAAPPAPLPQDDPFYSPYAESAPARPGI